MCQEETEQQRISHAINKVNLKNAVIISIDQHFYRTVNYCRSRDPLSTTEKYNDSILGNKPLTPHTVICFQACLSKVIDISDLR